MCTAGAYVMHFGILLLHAQAGIFEFATLAASTGSHRAAAGAAIAAPASWWASP